MTPSGHAHIHSLKRQETEGRRSCGCICLALLSAFTAVAFDLGLAGTYRRFAVFSSVAVFAEALLGAPIKVAHTVAATVQCAVLATLSDASFVAALPSVVTCACTLL